ncbi:MAG: hypothetical protein ACO1SX_17105 [Actinomycetota bacterium]
MTDFWSAAGAEARAAWGGRFRWLWLALALGFEAVMLFATIEPGEFFQQWSFRALCLLAAWLPAWLCADLLSLRFSSNPDPLREWTPAEFAARAAGRLAPAFLALLVFAATLTTRFVASDQTLAAQGFFRVQLGWTVVILASATTYAATAALMSATSRRPRRLPVVAVIVFVGMLCDFAAASWVFAGMRSTTPMDITLSNIALHGSTPNLWIGVAAWGIFSALRLGKWAFERGCWAATAAFLTYTLGVSALIWRIAVLRYRRHHPSSQAAEMPRRATSDPVPNS